MDNLCHTLVGLALGEAGLKRRTPLATAALVIGANLPDLDALSYLAGGRLTALGFRRGWTHGIPALAIWPLVLAALLLGWDRLVRRRRRPGAPPSDPRGLLLVAAVAVLSHPALDFLNTYGMRWLMPFSGRWLYGDTLFIVDPWVWAVLAAGVLLERGPWRASGTARVAPRVGPARLALLAVGAYIILMGLLGVAGRGMVSRAVRSQGLPLMRLMVAPVPINPLRREFVFELPSGYVRGEVRFLRRPAVTWESDAISKLADTPISRAAAATREGRTYLGWARFPFFTTGPYDGCPALHVCLRDARYYPREWAEVALPLGLSVSYAPSFPP